MATDALGIILSDLAKIIKVPRLEPDKNNSCLLRLKSGLKVQIELDKGQEFLIVGINVGQVPVGAFRVNLFRRALQFNGLPPPRHGTLAYSRRADSLVLFQRLPIVNLVATDVASALEMMVPKAQMWLDALQRGVLPELPSSAGPPEETGNVFGLKH